MRGNIGLLAPLLITILAVGAHGAAAQTAQLAKADGVASLPFAPPLGQKLTYRLERSRKGLAPAQPAVSTEIEITFRRAGSHLAMDVNPSALAELTRNPAFPLLSIPITFRVSAEGEIVGVENEKRYWRVFEQALVLRTTAGKGGGGRNAAQSSSVMMRGLPATARMAMLTKQLAPILAMSSSELRFGETMEGELQAESAFGPVPQQVSVRLEQIKGGRATVTSRRSTSPTQAVAAMRNFSAQFGNASPMALKVLRVDEEEVYEVSVQTGLTEKYSSTMTIEMEAAGKRQNVKNTDTLQRVR